MNRLGLSLRDLPRLHALLPAFTPALAMSHFVSAEDVSAPRNRLQIERFEEACGQLPPMPASLCNSSGMFLEEAPFLDLTRPGYALYGGNPTPGSDNPMRRVVGLTVVVLQVREIAGGETAGYNAIWTAPSRRKLATINLGYADGFLRSGSGGPLGVEVFAGGRYCPVVGRISMDLSIIDISEADPLSRGDRIEILGPNVSVDELAAQAGTIGYEILTDLGKRYRREYRNETVAAGGANRRKGLNFCPTPRRRNGRSISRDGSTGIEGGQRRRTRRNPGETCSRSGARARRTQSSDRKI